MNRRRIRWAFLLVLACDLAGARARSSAWTAVEARGQGSGPLARIRFISDSVGWIVAGQKTLLKTIDSAKTWTVLRTNLDEPDTEVAGIWFANENRGWGCG